MAALTANVPTEVGRLDRLGDDAFLREVADNLDTGTGSREIWAALAHPDLVDRTAGCLDEIAEQLERRIRERNLPAAHALPKRLNVVNVRRAQIAGAIRRLERAAAHVARSMAEAESDRAVLQLLALAVDAHRRACIAADLAPEPHDLALWSALEQLRLPAADTVSDAAGPSLAEMIVNGYWYGIPVSGDGAS